MTNGPSVPEEGKILKGIFYDSPVQGLEYETQTLSGITNEKGEFRYALGETVTFSVGGFVLGSVLGGKLLTPADLAIDVGKDIRKLKNEKVTNISRFLQSLDEDDNVENGITISEKTGNLVKDYIYKIDFEQTEEEFTEDMNIKELFDKLSKKLRTAAQARNHLRRTLYGIKKMTDVKIPTRDGSYLLSDIFTPIKEGKYPVIISMGVFGKAFQNGSICNEEDLLESEVLEDRWFEGSPSDARWGGGPTPWENHETANSTDWVPKGYVIIRVDSRGVGKTPGMFEQFSLQEAKDFYDAIEWAAKQPWSNGNIGTWGTGYYAATSFNVAQMNPPSLKAMVPICPDIDSYRDYIYVGGGLYSTFNFVIKDIIKNYCGEWQGVEWIQEAYNNPFYDPTVYGPEGSLCISSDVTKITVPFWTGMGLTGTLHTRGTSEAFIHAVSKDKKLTIISEPRVHYWAWSKEFIEKHMAFLNYWLKGEDNGIMDEPPVRMMVRTGRRGYYWQDENEWPIARTKYTRYYLDASPSTWSGDGKRSDFLKLDKTPPKEERSATYDAGVEWEDNNNWAYGVSFVTDPMPEDTLIVGYLKLVAWVSSTSRDMELHASLRVMDGGNEVPYPTAMSERSSSKYFPISWGALKVSHRKLDLEKSNEYRPFHTHLKEDYQPLTPGEVVEAEVEIWPTTALIKKGYRIRLDIQPVSGDQIPMRIYDAVDQTYQKGASNTIYTGPEHQSYLQLPIIPPKL